MASEGLSLPRSTVLLVSSHTQDHDDLQRIFCGSRWDLQVVRTVNDGLDVVRLRPFESPVMICEHTLPEGGWELILTELCRMAVRPRLIVSSRFADDRLWAEVLCQGAFDLLLGPPFVREEVLWVTQSAWIDWNSEVRASSAPHIGPQHSRGLTDREERALAACNHG